MKRTSGKIGLAAALGSGIGALVAHSLSPFFWWVGLLVGAFAGYIAYDLKAVVRSIVPAFRAAMSGDWLPTKAALLSASFLGALVLIAGIWLESVLLVMGLVAPGNPTMSTDRMVTVGTATGVAILGFALLFFALVLVCDWRTKSAAFNNKQDWMRLVEVLPPVAIAYHLPRALWKYGPPTVQAVFGFCRRFAWQMFLRIHSEARLTGMTAAFCGTAAGYLCSSDTPLGVLVGAIVGFVFGYLEHAFVAERWLKPRGYLSAA